jgi:hypothetical protein
MVRVGRDIGDKADGHRSHGQRRGGPYTLRPVIGLAFTLLLLPFKMLFWFFKVLGELLEHAGRSNHHRRGRRRHHPTRRLSAQEMVRRRHQWRMFGMIVSALFVIGILVKYTLAAIIIVVVIAAIVLVVRYTSSHRIHNLEFTRITPDGPSGPETAYLATCICGAWQYEETLYLWRSAAEVRDARAEYSRHASQVVPS